MDRVDTGRIKALLNKYKYVLFVLILGMILMTIPESKSVPEQADESSSEPTAISMSQQLEEILTQISGVGRARVLLTEAVGAETEYQTNQDSTSTGDSTSLRVETVLVAGSSREEQGLIRSVTPPVYLGAIIVCQGGDDPLVKLSVVDAVSDVTGLGADRITVLKMK